MPNTHSQPNKGPTALWICLFAFLGIQIVYLAGIAEFVEDFFSGDRILIEINGVAYPKSIYEREKDLSRYLGHELTEKEFIEDIKILALCDNTGYTVAPEIIEDFIEDKFGALIERYSGANKKIFKSQVYEYSKRVKIVDEYLTHLSMLEPSDQYADMRVSMVGTRNINFSYIPVSRYDDFFPELRPEEIPQDDSISSIEEQKELKVLIEEYDVRTQGDTRTLESIYEREINRFTLQEERELYYIGVKNRRDIDAIQKLLKEGVHPDLLGREYCYVNQRLLTTRARCPLQTEEIFNACEGDFITATEGRNAFIYVRRIFGQRIIPFNYAKFILANDRLAVKRNEYSKVLTRAKRNTIKPSQTIGSLWLKEGEADPFLDSVYTQLKKSSDNGIVMLQDGHVYRVSVLAERPASYMQNEELLANKYKLACISTVYRDAIDTVDKDTLPEAKPLVVSSNSRTFSREELIDIFSAQNGDILLLERPTIGYVVIVQVISSTVSEEEEQKDLLEFIKSIKRKDVIASIDTMLS